MYANVIGITLAQFDTLRSSFSTWPILNGHCCGQDPIQPINSAFLYLTYLKVIPNPTQCTPTTLILS